MAECISSVERVVLGADNGHVGQYNRGNVGWSGWRKVSGVLWVKRVAAKIKEKMGSETSNLIWFGD